jgi:hypothetical protein
VALRRFEQENADPARPAPGPARPAYLPPCRTPQQIGRQMVYTEFSEALSAYTHMHIKEVIHVSIREITKKDSKVRRFACAQVFSGL